VILDQLKTALAHNDAEMLRVVVERIGLAIDRARGDRIGTNAAWQALMHFDRCPPVARHCACVELGRLAQLAELYAAGQIARPLAVEVITKETPRGPDGAAGRLPSPKGATRSKGILRW
jgi:hypothetical protein